MEDEASEGNDALTDAAEVSSKTPRSLRQLRRGVKASQAHLARLEKTIRSLERVLMVTEPQTAEDDLFAEELEAEAEELEVADSGELLEPTMGDSTTAAADATLAGAGTLGWEPSDSNGWRVPASDHALSTFLGDIPQTTFTGSETFGYPVERLMPRHADIETATFPSLDDLVAGRNPEFRSLEICIVTPDIFGPIRNGGIGTAYYQVARFLAEAGHRVTILFTLGRHCENGTPESWIEYYAKLGVTFVPMPSPQPEAASGMLGRNLSQPRAVYEWLKKQHFDLVHVTEWRGAGYFALMAKRLGIAFQDTLFLVKTSSPTLWSALGNGELLSKTETIVRSYIERKSVELADIVIAPSQHMLRWMMRYGYDLKKQNCFVHPNVMPVPATSASRSPDSELRTTEVRELVFFGRLEPRKGIHVFCKALSMAKATPGASITVTFLGKRAKSFDINAFLAQAAKLDIKWQIIDDKNAEEAIEYLKQPGRVAVIPSLLDNSPITIYECLANGIAFVTSDRGGGQELIAEEDRPHVIFRPVPAQLGRLFDDMAVNGVRVARPSFDMLESLETWRRAHLIFAQEKATFSDPERHRTWNGVAPRVRLPEEPLPLISVCFAYFNRPSLMAQALASIKAQTYPNIEVVVVDDGSTNPEALQYLESLKPEFADRGWKILHQPNSYPGAARNAAWRSSLGEFVLFMDDDNVAKTNEIETFLHAADCSGADILCSFSDAFGGLGAPHEGTEEVRRITPLGDHVSLGLFLNCYGDTNCFVRRRVLETLGGFTEDYGVGREDQELFSRAVLSGFKLMVVPEALFWYRRSEARIRDQHFDKNSGDLRAFGPYLDNVPLCVHEALRLAQGWRNEVETLRGSVRRLRRAMREIRNSFDALRKVTSA